VPRRGFRYDSPVSGGEQALERVIRTYFDPKKSLATVSACRQAWFSPAEDGQALFFLFTKNLGVTNVQHAELLSLLRRHTYDRASKREAEALYFVTSEEFEKLLLEVTESFADQSSVDRLAKDTASLYIDLFARTVVVDSYFGSCNVFVPPPLAIDLMAICGEAGYIHSCGYSVFVRNMTKAEPYLLTQKLDEHLKRLPPLPDKRLRFLVYADEDFTDYDREQASLLSAGLDDAKLHVEKAWFRSQRVVDVLTALEDELDGRIIVGKSGDYRDTIADHAQLRDIDKTRTLWLVQDRSIGDPCERPGNDRFYICYDQLFRNRNAVYVFDENKPAWRAHTTLPPTLAGALVNLVRRRERDNKTVHIADPFIGTGTSLLEAMRFPVIKFDGSDIDPISERLLIDNIAFFGMDASEARAIEERLRETREELDVALNGIAQGSVDAETLRDTPVYAAARKVLSTDDFATQAQAVDLPGITLSGLGEDLFERLLAYIALRTSQRHSARFVRQQVKTNSSWFAAYVEETRTLITQFKDLVDHLEKSPLAEDRRSLADRHKLIDDGQTVRLIHDHYSTACVPLYQGTMKVEITAGRGEGRDGYFFEQCSATDLPHDCYDIIIGDPPYGFNTVDGTEKLANLYRSFTKAVLLALRDGGDLILCLPERSHSGRYSPAFTHRELVTHELHLSAGKLRRQLIFPRDGVRGSERLFGDNYYWESPKALRRSVLHVQVRRLAAA
jgi:Putative RNA methylase family UPF0020